MFPAIFPPSILLLFGRMLAMSDLTSSLLGSFKIDISETRKILDWTPPFTLEEELAMMAENYTVVGFSH